MAEPTDEHNQPGQVHTSGGTYVEGGVESKEFVGRDQHIHGHVIYGNVIHQHLNPPDAPSQAKEKLYNSRRSYYARMGQVSVVVIMLAFTAVLGNFQVISQSLSDRLHPNLPPTPTVEAIVPTVPLPTKTPLPVPTTTPQPTATITGVLWNCEGKDYNCTDFTFRDEAQEIYDFCVESVGYDIYGLDLDHDGVACESVAEPARHHCEENIYNCTDFASQDEAQQLHDFCWYSTNIDVHRLDPDRDGIACER